MLAEVYLYNVTRNEEKFAVPERASDSYRTHYAFVHELGELVAFFGNFLIATNKNRVTFYGGEGLVAPDPKTIVSNRGGSLTPELS